MLLTLGLVIGGDLVFLRNVWATVIPSLALLFSIIGTFGQGMLGYSLDNLSMMALILSVRSRRRRDRHAREHHLPRHVELGEDPLTASLVDPRIGFTIVSIDLCRSPLCSSWCYSWACSAVSFANFRSASASRF